MSRPRALDLFCGAGGAAMGLYRAGFDVVGVDARPQRRYPFRFVQADALRPPLRLEDFDFVWASPPCQRYSRVTVTGGQDLESYPDLVAETRALLVASGRPYCMENVPAAPLRPDLMLTGAQFDLDIVRQRLFEIEGFAVPFALAPQQMRKTADGGLATVAGHGANNSRSASCRWRDLPADLKRRLSERNSAAGWRQAMGIDWMTRKELAQAVPPAYAEHIGRAAMAAIAGRIAA